MNDIFITLNTDKEPYIKKLTNDKIINLTGESGSGKSYYAEQYKNNDNYIVIDTDDVFARYDNARGYNKEFGSYLREKYSELPSLIENFDLIYDETINYFKDTSKTIVVDSAQFRNIKDISKLKGTVIVMRTSIDRCYKRCIKRFNDNNPYATNNEKKKYAERKKNIYKWYKSLNAFLEKVDKYEVQTN